MKQVLQDIIITIRSSRYAVEEKGVALIETVVLFPILAILMIGCFDLGQGIILNQKTIGASQIIGDLITRNKVVTVSGLTDMIKAGELAYEPYPTDTFGYDIASIRFDEDGDPVVLWRMTDNMSPNEDAVESTEGLGVEGEGIVVVTTTYIYDPYFVNFVVPDITMQEVAFLKGRKSATVACSDCP